MDGWTIIGIAATVIGIAAGIVQVLDYMQKRRAKREEPGTERPSSPPLPTPDIPHNLPPRSEFIGREAEKARVHEALRSRSYLISIDGIGGIGKTSLALEVAHECLQASRDPHPANGIALFAGYIWATARDRDLTLNGLLDAVARTLDYPGIVQQPIEEKRLSVRRLLQAKPYLLIVDNYETIKDDRIRDFVRDLPEPSKGLLTTREQKLRQARAISIRGLEQPEALSLIRSEGRRLGLASLERAQDQVLLHLYQATGGAPLAIKWAVGQIVQRGQSLDTVLTALHEARGDIFDNIFARSWSLLAENAQQVLLVMPLFATSASRAGIEAASDVHHFALDDALGQLVEMSLVEATDELDSTQRRYSIHPLTRSFAAARSQSERATSDGAQRRLAGFYQRFARENGGFWTREGFSRLAPELPNLLAIIQWCWENGHTNQATATYFNISGFMINRGLWNDILDLGQQALARATRPKDKSDVQIVRVWPIAWLYYHRGDLDAAEDQIRSALGSFEQTDERAAPSLDVYVPLGKEGSIALAKRTLGCILRERGDLAAAEPLLRESLDFYRLVGNERFSYMVTSDLARVVMELGNLDQAWALCHDVLGPARQYGDPERISSILGVLGGVAYRRANLRQAEEFLEDALYQTEQMDRLDAIADARYQLARVKLELDKLQTAHPLLLSALETYRRLDMRSGMQRVESLLARWPEPTTDTDS